jgi:hypothetical protein
VKTKTKLTRRFAPKRWAIFAVAVGIVVGTLLAMNWTVPYAAILLIESVALFFLAPSALARRERELPTD